MVLISQRHPDLDKAFKLPIQVAVESEHIG
jgi:hypothetical protein